ncbi:porin family protein [bacterium]|nr:porin family protein [bacterium]
MDTDTQSYDVFIAACPVCECPAPAKRDNYAGFRVYINEHSSYSYSLANDKTIKHIDDNLGFGTTMGSNLTPYLRTEYETLYMGAQYSKSDMDFEYDIWVNMLNIYIMHEFDNAFSPYIGAGLGLSGIWGEINGHLANAFDLSYQAMAGVLFKLNSRIDIDIGFKYTNFGQIEHPRGTTKIDATQIYIGGVYKFGL